MTITNCAVGEAISIASEINDELQSWIFNEDRTISPSCDTTLALEVITNNRVVLGIRNNNTTKFELELFSIEID